VGPHDGREVVAGVDDVRAAVVPRIRVAHDTRVLSRLGWLFPTTATLVVWVCGCDGREVRPRALVGAAGPERSSTAPNGRAVVDSSLPLDEALQRFRAGLPVASRLSGGALTRESLVRRFVRAVEQRDTAAVRAMVLSRAEFAYLYYPHSAFTREPHKQMAGLVWLFTQVNSSKGITRVFDRLGDGPLSYRGHRCRARPRRQGPNRLWEDCALQLGDDPGASEVRLFGSIIERDGQLKFVSYANDF
jgi:hypothetical protein